jgi:hypothetical protein
MSAFVPPQPELERSLHRKNAVEWILWTLLLPLVPMAWMMQRVKRRESDI